MSDYQNFPIRAVDIGLDLRDAPDKVSEGKWTRLTNVRSTQEALIATREGRSLVVDYASLVLSNTEVHTIKRIGPTNLLVGVGFDLFTNATKYNDPVVGEDLVITTFSGNPVSAIPFRPLVSPSPWTYIADSAKMRKVHSDGRIFQWGVTRPAEKVSASAAGTGSLDSSVPGAITYRWKATYYSDVTGAESNGSDEMETGLSGTGVAANLSIAGSLDPQVSHVRFYRTGGTNTTGVYRLDVSAANVPNGTVTATSTAADSTIATAKPLASDNDVPFTSVSANGSQAFGVAMPYAAGPFLGKFILAVGDPNRPGYFYWTNPDNPDGASSTNNVQVTNPNEPLIGVFLYDGRPFVWSRGNLYEMEYGLGAVTFRGRLTSCGRGLATPWAYAIGPEIYFLSGDGIYSTTGDSPAQSITDDSLRPLFQGQTVGGMAPLDWRPAAAKYIRLWYMGQELHFTYLDTAGVHHHLYWSSQYQRWKKLSQSGQNIVSGYATENTPEAQTYFGTKSGQLFFSSTATSTAGDNVIPTTDNGTAISVAVRTGSHDMQATATLKEFGGLIVDADVPSGVTITLLGYLNGESSSFTIGTIVGLGLGRRKYAFTLQDTFAYSIAFDLSWIGVAKVYQMEILWRPDEEDIVHWSFPPTSHGLSGWQQLRDLYLTTRNLVPLTLSISADGDSPDQYPIPATGGSKLKQHIKLRPRKAKLFKYDLDTTEAGIPFRVYGEDCELRLKVWNTNLGYDLVSPFKRPGE